MLKKPCCFIPLISALMGLLFPIGSIIFLLFYTQKNLSLATIQQFHNTQPLLIIIWLAPLILGAYGYILGKFAMKIKEQSKSEYIQKTTLETIFNTVASAIISIDQKGIVTKFNKAAERIFGYTAREVVGKNIKMLMPEKIASQHDQYLKNYLLYRQENIIGKQREVEARHKDGTHFPATLKVNILNLQGTLHFTGVIDDISETKNIMAQLNQAQKMEAMGQLAAGIAHEINTPIQYIGDNLHALKSNFDELQALILKSKHKFTEFSADLQQEWNDWEEQFDTHFILHDTPFAIKQSLDGIEKVSGIVQAMKVFSHTNNQATSFANLNEILKNTLTISKNEYKYIADIETNFASDLPDVECYANELNQVLLNLIVNAAYAIEEKKSGQGLIKITTEKQQDTIYIKIQDNGTGIPKAIQDKVFNLFFTTKEVGRGSGQGLSIAHKIIVEKHQGKFYFDSIEGKGTTFHIILPLNLAKTNPLT